MPELEPLAIINTGGGLRRSLDLSEEAVRDDVGAFDGAEVAVLCSGDTSAPYVAL